MTDKPIVSVILPIYNRTAFLSGAIESILEQSFENLELVIVDDGSDDSGPLNIARQYEGRQHPGKPPICVVHRSQNGGLAAARNTGIENARGEYIALMDDDDVSHPRRIAAQCEFLETHPEFSAISCPYDEIDAQGHRIRKVSASTVVSSGGATPDSMANVYHYLLNPTSMLRREVLIGIGGFRPWFRGAEDLDLTLRIEEKWRIARIPECLYLYRNYRGGKLSASIDTWHCMIAAMTSAWHRRNGLDDPLNGSPTMQDMIALFMQTDLSEEVRIKILRSAFGHCRRAVRCRDYERLHDILRLCCHCVRAGDRRTRTILKGFRRRLFTRAILHGRFTWF